jgi:hypothetical protein
VLGVSPSHKESCKEQPFRMESKLAGLFCSPKAKIISFGLIFSGSLSNFSLCKEYISGATFGDKCVNKYLLLMK